MEYKEYLILLKKDKSMRKIWEETFRVYKSKYWTKETIKRLTWPKIGAWKQKLWKFKLTDQKIEQIKTDASLWIPVDKIATNYWISIRTVYRYKDK